MELWGLASLELAWQASSLETQAGFCAVTSKQNYFSRKFEFWHVRPSTDWIRPTYVFQGNLLYLK
jgi:hypothetical protein